jgi:acetyltransferase-like isoleucine patch superfamily enzyme
MLIIDAAWVGKRMGRRTALLRRYPCEWIVLHLPATRLGNRVKFLALRWAGADVQWPLHIDANVWIRGPENFRAGRAIVISRGAIVNCAAAVTLGAECLLGYCCYLGTAMHNVPPGTREPIIRAGHSYHPVELGSGCWIGAHACVLPGVTLGDGAVVGAGGIATHDLPAGAIATGPAASVMRVRESDGVAG